MKKSILILCACAAFAGCSEDDLVVKKPAVPGSEVQFGATAYMSNGNGTRTVYGDADATNGKIELRWVVGDKIDIACKQAAEGRRLAAYEIVETTIVGDENSIDNSQATKLEKVGEYGIQWGVPGNHDFYALYPSSESFDATERGEIGIDAGGVNGYLPVNQDPKDVVTEVTKDGKTNYILEPDMRYAFMVAQTEVNSATDGDAGVSLRFEPLVTALQFELTAPDIINNTTESTKLTITAVSLNTVNEQNICGSFQYKFEGRTITDKNTTTGFSRITQTIPDSNPVILNAGTGNKVDVTFFVLPSANIADGNLRLQVFYTYNGSPYVKTLLIGKELTARKKYYFRNVQLPQIDVKVQGSSWFSALDPNVYISQLSIPVAGNAFSSYYSGTTPEFYQEQTLDYTKLWNKGVRGFEFCTSYGSVISYSIGEKHYFNNKNTLENEYFVCNGAEMTDAKASDGTAVTFGNAFRTLVGLLNDENYKNECLIIICTYKSYNNDSPNYSPQQYISDLESFLSSKDNATLLKDKLVKLTPTSTVGDLQGKIAIIVRPGDDAVGSTQSLTVTNNKLTLVKDWGTCVDKWNRRFGSSYAIEGALAKTGETKIEDYLWGASEYNDKWQVAGEYSFKSDKYPKTNSFNFDHNTASSEKVYVQEFARIVPNKTEYTKFKAGADFSANEEGYTARNLSDTHDGGYYLWLNWPESYTQKQEMIKTLVGKSMGTKGQTPDGIFINSLCGFYPTTDLKVSYLPYNSTYTTNLYSKGTAASDFNVFFKLSGAGAGGDFVACAYDLNKWFYKYLTEENVDNKGVLKQGPVGLVMLNHIGNTSKGTDDKSLDLVNWIMMNNFKFPLATAKTNGNTQGTGTGGRPAVPGGGAS